MEQQYSHLSPAKKALLEKWKRGKLQTETIPKRQNSQPVPLSFSQKRLWFIDRLYHGSSFYHVSSALHLTGLLNVTALQRSLNEILRRHEAWRTIFVTEDEQPIQIILPQLTWEMPIINIEHLANIDWEIEVKQIATKVAQKPFNLATGPLVRATLLRLRETEHILLLTIHHIITDGWSMGVFAQELAKLYSAFCKGQPSP
ncbi:MAG: condensation domain-containing protein, partial [Fischerella sp.]|nr:condensation domain-containing protein [Fischerella sp.]